MTHNECYPLVSLITPCYNGEEYIGRLLESVLNQSYSNIEYYVVDDGSCDNSANIIKSYIPKFKERGFDLHYIYQKNSGQSVALNTALKLVKGDYLLWPDADDFYSDNNSIIELYSALLASENKVAMVRCLYTFVDADEEVVARHRVEDIDFTKTNLFKDALSGKNGFWYPPGGYMVKMAALRELIANMEIFTMKEAGQNYQLYLPVLYYYECITIPRHLYTVFSRKDSHSRNINGNIQKQIAIIDVYYMTICETLKLIPRISETELTNLLSIVEDDILRRKFYAYCKAKDKKNAFVYLNKIRKINKLQNMVRLYLLFIKYCVI